MSEFILNIGKKGEIYTTRKIREAIGLKENTKVVVKIKEGYLLIEPLPNVEEVLNKNKFLKRINADNLDEILDEE